MNQLAVVGLGYVGLGLLIALSKQSKVLGYDINQERIKELRAGYDRNHLIDSVDLGSKQISYTDQVHEIRSANFYIVSVATPAYYYEMPNLEPLIGATTDLAAVLKKGDVVVYESTVYPGTTESICIPLLEKLSQLKNGKDFFVGYSPERINPGDSKHTLKTITKIISAQEPKTLDRIKTVYESICDTVYPVSSIATAEATKLLENTQRDVNIALMNEFSQIMHTLNIDLHEMIEAAKTKWGFVPYRPGFVGGHCISIDPHYLVFEAKRHGLHPDLMLAARKVNDGVTQFVLQSMVKLLIQQKKNIDQVRVGLFGVTYKANVLDLRNSLSLKLLKELKAYGFECLVHDPLVLDVPESLQLESFENMHDLTVAMILVGHEFYKNLGLEKIRSTCANPAIVMDIPNLFVGESKQRDEIIYWNL